MSKLGEVLSRNDRRNPPRRQELLDRLQNLRRFVEGLASHLSRQDLEDVLKESCHSAAVFDSNRRDRSTEASPEVGETEKAHEI